VDELAAQAAALVARRPQDARLRRVGTSRAGTPLWLLSVGHGSRQALVVAGPHANEPVGGATVLRLAERVLADPRLSEGADATWNLLLCLDPDGSRRNEGWLPGPYSLGRYFRNFFRPGFLEQPEWLPDGAAGARLPETRALLEVQDELRPFLQCSLHGVDVGGGFVELTRDLPGLARRVAHTAARLGIPRELGPYDTLYWPRLGPAVYRIPPPRPGDLAAAITEAAVESTWYHPHRHGTVTAVVEAPMWGVAGVEDGTPPADADAFLRTVSHTLRHDTRILEQLLARIRPFVQGGTEAGTGVGLRDAWPRPAADPIGAPARDTADTRPRTLVVPDAARLLAPVDDYLLVMSRARRRVGSRCRHRRRPPAAAAQHRPSGRPADRGAATGAADGRAAVPARDRLRARSGRCAAGVGPADRRVVRRLPRRLRGALDLGRAPGRVPVARGAQRVRTGPAARARALPFG
jgi:hypothetical protein